NSYAVAKWCQTKCTCLGRLCSRPVQVQVWFRVRWLAQPAAVWLLSLHRQAGGGSRAARRIAQGLYWRERFSQAFILAAALRAAAALTRCPAAGDRVAHQLLELLALDRFFLNQDLSDVVHLQALVGQGFLGLVITARDDALNL